MKKPISKETNKKRYMELYYGALIFFILNLIYKETAFLVTGVVLLLLGIYRKYWLHKKLN